jgi:tetratricopeptide (TPR) repeat protein
LSFFFKALWYLPLAIIQAGAFISKSGALDSYLALYTKNRAHLLSEKPAQAHDDYAWTVYTTWQISFEQLTIPASTLLQLCSLIHHEGISEDIFSNASRYTFPARGPPKEQLQKPLEFLAHFLEPTGVWDSLRFMTVLNEIRAFSLLDFDAQKKSFSIHPLVHSWTRSTLMDEQSFCYSMIAIVAMSFAATPRREKQLASVKLLPHVDSLIHGEVLANPDFRAHFGVVYLWARRPEDARQLMIAVFEDQKRKLGEDHPDTLISMANLASTYHDLGKLTKAEELKVLVFEKRREILGADHPDTLFSMGELASTYYQLGKLNEAEELQVVVFKKRREILEEDHPHTLLSMSALASTYHQLHKLKEAEELLVAVLEKRRRSMGEDHPVTLFSFANLAATYLQLGKLNEAEELTAVVLEKRRVVLGEDHPDTLFSMGEAASIYLKVGKLNEAQKLAAVVLEKRRQLFGEDHLETLRAMNNLVWIYLQIGQLKEAEKLQVELLDRKTNLLAPDHPDTLCAARNLEVIRKIGQVVRTAE